MYILLWYLVNLHIGILGTIGLSYIFKRPFKEFYLIGRIFGLIVVGYFSWTLSYLNLVPFTLFGIWGIVITLFLFAILINKNFLHHKITLKSVLRCFYVEIFYATPFVLYLLYVMMFPEIHQGEKFFNFAIVNSLFRTEYLPPQDIWFSGSSLNYYYFGHYVYVLLAKMARIPSAYAFNLILITIFTNSVVACHWIVKKLTGSDLYALLGIALLLIVGNLYPIYVLIKGLPINRVLDSVIFSNDGMYHEFPAYSFLLGGFHAHVLNIPFVLLTLIILYLCFERGFKNRFYVLLLGFLLGTIFVTNTWDFPTYVVIVVSLLTLTLVQNSYMLYKALSRALLSSIAIILFSILFYLPYHLENNVQGILGLGLVKNTYGIDKIVLMFGFFLLFCGLWVVKKRALLTWEKLSKAEVFALLLIIVSLLILVFSEIFYFKDMQIFFEPRNYRANTVFKFWYQVWILLSITTPVVLIQLFRDKYHLLIKALFVPLLFISFIYPAYVFSLQFTGFREASKELALQGMQYLSKKDQDTYDAINHLNGPLYKPDLVLLEAPGEAYESNNSIYSTFTGFASVIGWVHHEVIFQGDLALVEERTSDVNTLYFGASYKVIAQLLEKYEIDLVVISNLEKDLYGENAGSGIRVFSTPVYKNDSVEILKINKDVIKKFSQT